MNIHDWQQTILFYVVLLLLVRPLGGYMAKVYQGERTLLSGLLAPCGHLFYRISGVGKDEEMDWQHYAGAMLLFNLLDNGLKYSLSGSTLEIRAKVHGRKLLIEVLDRGPGIPRHDLKRVFDKFYRLPVPEGVGGTGLGDASRPAFIVTETGVGYRFKGQV